MYVNIHYLVWYFPIVYLRVMCNLKKVILLVYNAVKTVWQLHMNVLPFNAYILSVFSTPIHIHVNLTINNKI